MKTPANPKHYKHREESLDEPGRFYCAACDLFVPADHWPRNPRDPADVSAHERADQNLLRPNRRQRRY